jgi:hypothetical protein
MTFLLGDYYIYHFVQMVVKHCDAKKNLTLPALNLELFGTAASPDVSGAYCERKGVN